MWHYVFLLLRRQPGKSALVSSGFLLAACALILLSATTQTTLVQGNQIINQNWRPTYDLVVLPPQAKIPANPTVPSDLLAGYSGGISVQQYEQIKNLPGIETAAPIAYVGYIHMPVPTIYFSDHSYPTGYYQLDWTLSAFNGQRNIVELQERYIIYIISSNDSANSVGENANSQPPDVLGTFGGQINEVESETGDNPAPMPTPDVGTFLLAAIDPAAENQLVHLDKSISSGRMLTEQDTIHLDKSIPGNPGYNPYLHKTIPYVQIPMLIHRSLPGQIALNAKFTLLYDGPLTPNQIVAKGGIPYLQQLPNRQILFDGSVPLVQNDPQASPAPACSGMGITGRSFDLHPAKGLNRTISWIFPQHPLLLA